MVKKFLRVMVGALMVGSLMYVQAPTADASHDQCGVDKEKAVPSAGKSNGSPPNCKFDGPHEAVPKPPVPSPVKADCVVAGDVVIGQAKGAKDGQGVEPDPGLGGTPNHNHFFFRRVAITCVDRANPVAGPYTGIFDVEAEGGTDGEAPVPATPENPLGDVNKKDGDAGTNHGETITQGWSHSSLYCQDSPENAALGVGDQSNFNGFPANMNKGSIWVQKRDSAQRTAYFKDTDLQGAAEAGCNNNWVKFVRGRSIPETTPVTDPDGPDNSATPGSEVVAWGWLSWMNVAKKTGNPPDCFRANLSLTPGANIVADKDSDPTNGLQPVLRNATITGTAVIYNLGNWTDQKVPTITGAGTATCDRDDLTPTTELKPKPTTTTAPPAPGPGNGGGNGNGHGGGSRGGSNH